MGMQISTVRTECGNGCSPILVFHGGQDMLTGCRRCTNDDPEGGEAELRVRSK